MSVACWGEAVRAVEGRCSGAESGRFCAAASRTPASLGASYTHRALATIEQEADAVSTPPSPPEGQAGVACPPGSLPAARSAASRALEEGLMGRTCIPSQIYACDDDNTSLSREAASVSGAKSGLLFRARGRSVGGWSGGGLLRGAVLRGGGEARRPGRPGDARAPGRPVERVGRSGARGRRGEWGRGRGAGGRGAGAGGRGPAMRDVGVVCGCTTGRDGACGRLRASGAWAVRVGSRRPPVRRVGKAGDR